MGVAGLLEKVARAGGGRGGGCSRPHCDREEVVGFVGTSGAGDARNEVHDA